MPSGTHRKKQRHDPSLWRLLTSGRRVLPDVVIVGAQRAGTTSCFRYVEQHPQVVGAIRKEVHYFDVDAKFAKGEGWYRAHFPTTRELAALERSDGLRRLVLESTPAYMFRDYAPARMVALLPEAKLVAVLRNPVDRALSNWKLGAKWGRQYAPFELEVEHEFCCLEGKPSPLGDKKPRNLLGRGRYLEQLERLLEHYPRQQLYVADSSDLYRDATAFTESIFEFLELEPIEIDAQKVHNFSSDRRPMEAQTRARLQEYFAPFNAALFEFLGRDLGWND